jgi:hypothetical protein
VWVTCVLCENCLSLVGCSLTSSFGFKQLLITLLDEEKYVLNIKFCLEDVII